MPLNVPLKRTVDAGSTSWDSGSTVKLGGSRLCLKETIVKSKTHGLHFGEEKYYHMKSKTPRNVKQIAKPFINKVLLLSLLPAEFVALQM